jgi:hypothetical protein
VQQQFDVAFEAAFGVASAVAKVDINATGTFAFVEFRTADQCTQVRH